LQQRPHWRQSGDDRFLEAQITFNQWLKNRSGNVTPKIELIDTTDDQVNTTVPQVATWIRDKVS
jgi:hypothetical protein